MLLERLNRNKRVTIEKEKKGTLELNPDDESEIKKHNEIFAMKMQDIAVGKYVGPSTELEEDGRIQAVFAERSQAYTNRRDEHQEHFFVSKAGWSGF